MHVQLIVEDKRHKGHVIPVNVPEFKIGQAEDCHLRSNSSRVGQQHCVIHTHGDTITIQDLGNETGTYVNGMKITSRQVLKDGDTLSVGKHSFIVSIKTVSEESGVRPTEVFELAQEEAADEESGIIFEIRHNGKGAAVTKSRLFELALQGVVLPDDIITFNGTKIFADSIYGITFKEQPSTVALPVRLDIPDRPPFNAAGEFLTVEKSAEVAAKPKTSQNQTSVQEENNFDSRRIRFFAAVFAAICLLVFLGIWYVCGQNSYGVVYIAGTLMLDGKPVEGASVILHPRSQDGEVAGGMTDTRGRFTVTTGLAPAGSGAKPGEYGVTFRKVVEVKEVKEAEEIEEIEEIDQHQQSSQGRRYVIPQKYADAKTSDCTIDVKRSGRNRFSFDLSSTPTG